MKIILVRHGHAEDKRESLDDKFRELTKKGRKRVKKSARALTEYLAGQETPLLWSSPALRAMQTAKIVSEELDIFEIPLHDFIYSGETSEGREVLSRLSEESIVILAGHEPHLSHWAEAITEEELPFKKSQIRAFEVDRKTLKGELVWTFPESKEER